MELLMILFLLRSIFFAIFASYLSYFFVACSQNCSTLQRIVILQNNFNTSSLFPYSKLHDKICVEDILFITKSLNNLSPSVFIQVLVFPQIK